MSQEDLKDEYHSSRMSYLKAVLKKDNQTKIAELKKLIALGEKLGKDTTPDKKKLEILLNREKKSTVNSSIKKDTSKSSINKVVNKSNSDSKHSISSVYTSNNQVIINFNKDVTKEFIKFFELKQPPINKDVFDIKGNFKDAKPTKLQIKGVDRIYIGQFEPYTLRIVIAHNKNLKTSYKIKKRQIVINIDSLKPISIGKPIKKEEKQVIKKTTSLSNNYVDTKNFIRSINTSENKIIVKFNKNFSKKHLKYSAYKHRNSFQDVFDITGEFKYAKPIKLNINGLDKISVGQVSNKLRIRLSNKKDLKVIYEIRKRELIIKILGLKNSAKTSKPALPYPNFKSKTIVIDAGHGGHDVGAVGPNKRYEKVVTLKIAKYLYSIMKQRGHKVYLTRSSDTFIKVGKRTDLALRKNADVFISIHANSIVKRKAHKVSGIETYYLSPAKTERAKRVAAKENKSDIRKMSNSTTQSFLSSLNSPKLRYSRLLSIDVQREMLTSVRTKHKVKDKGSRPGPFWVLLDAPQASILVEVGYISHPEEGKKLYNSSYQKLLAKGMANGIDAYFEMKARFD